MLRPNHSGKGCGDCGEDGPAEIELSNDAVNCFDNEGASSFFYWDKDRSGFVRIDISD